MIILIFADRTRRNANIVNLRRELPLTACVSPDPGHTANLPTSSSVVVKFCLIIIFDDWARLRRGDDLQSSTPMAMFAGG